MRGALVLAVLIVLVGASAGTSARAADAADVEAARRHFARGVSLFDANRFEQALAEFEEAARVLPQPELDYDIARCHDYLEHWQQAVDAYEKYLAARPDGPEAQKIRDRVRTLRTRLEHATTPVPPPTPAPALQIAPAPAAPRLSGLAIGAITMGAVTGVLAITGGALLGSIGPDYRDLEVTCAGRPCSSQDWSGLERRANVGYAIVALAGVAAAIDVALIVLTVRQRGRTPVRASAGGVEVRF